MWNCNIRIDVNAAAYQPSHGQPINVVPIDWQASPADKLTAPDTDVQKTGTALPRELGAKGINAESNMRAIIPLVPLVVRPIVLSRRWHGPLIAYPCHAC